MLTTVSRWNGRCVSPTILVSYVILSKSLTQKSKAEIRVENSVVNVSYLIKVWKLTCGSPETT